MTFDFESVREMLRCPVSGARFIRDAERLVSTDPETRLAYPIVDDIPKLLATDAETLSEEEWKSLMEQQATSE